MRRTERERTGGSQSELASHDQALLKSIRIGRSSDLANRSNFCQMTV